MPMRVTGTRDLYRHSSRQHSYTFIDVEAVTNRMQHCAVCQI